MKAKIPMQLDLVETDHGCLIPTSHKLNEGGYFRRRIPEKGRKREYFHRYIFRTHHGLESIPIGFEIDHMCGNRACCNVNHLRMLPKGQHISETIREANARKRAVAWLFWRGTRCTMSELGEAFGVSAVTAAKWMADFEQKYDEPQADTLEPLVDAVESALDELDALAEG